MTAELGDENSGFGSFWAHLPGILLDDGVTLSVGGAVIANLDFESWYALDREYWEPVNYNDTRPVFLSGPVEIAPGETDSVQAVRRLVSDVHHALLLSTKSPLPPPRLSCAYIPDESLVLPGACGREWIIGGYWKPIKRLLGPAELEDAAWVYDLLTETKGLWTGTEIGAAIEILELSAYPDLTIKREGIDWLNQFVHCIAAAERLLVPDEAKTGRRIMITPTFGRHAAILGGCTPDCIDEHTNDYSGLYRLRSRIIHGEVGAHNVAEDAEKFKQGRAILCLLVTKALALLRTTREPVVLTEILERASQDAAAYEALQRQIKKGLEA